MQYFKEDIQEIIDAADKGDTQAQFYLDIRYEHGSGVNQDSDKAVEYLQNSADQGYEEAQEHLVNMYKRDENNFIDATDLIQSHQKAADDGDKDAQFLLGFLYETFEKYDLAIKYYTKAADLGVINADQHLAVMYLDGEGVERDIRKAKAYFKKLK